MNLTFSDVAFEHWRDCCLVSNGCIELVVPRSFGPRVMGLRRAGGQNVFKIFPDEAPGARIRGGHRLWVAPERAEVTWIKDNDPVELERLDDGLRVTGALEPGTGLQKEMTIRFTAQPDEVAIAHQIRNRNPWAIKLAPWALTQMAPGGVALSGFPPRGKHPECLLPTNPLVMWAYTRLSDPRWSWGERFFALRQDPEAADPQKTGLFLSQSWLGYLLGSDLFVKWSTADPAACYPDFGCSLEVFTNRFMMELETLGPLAQIEPGEAIDHIEHWILLPDIRLKDLTDTGIEAAVAPALARMRGDI